MRLSQHCLAILPICLMVVSCGSALATVRPHSLFSDGAVLQQGCDMPVWGTASEGERVTVKFQGQEVSTTAHFGRWMLKLRPLTAGGPFAMRISGDNTIELNNIFVGEVWLCSGQWNMEFPVMLTSNAKEIIGAAGDPMLRLFTVPWCNSDIPIDEFKGAKGFAYELPKGVSKLPTREWCSSDSQATSVFSAVGYFFGRHLRKALGVPVGIINASVGATVAQAWMSRSTLQADPDLRSGPNLPRAPWAVGWNNPAGLYNGMIRPVQPFPIRGVLWYQGEGNVGDARAYRKILHLLSGDWRRDWGLPEMSFLIVQLAPFGKGPAEPQESSWAICARCNTRPARRFPSAQRS